VAVFVIALAGISYLAFESLSSQDQTIKEDLARLARAAAGVVDGDLHEKLTDPTSSSNTDYARALELLVDFHREVPEIAYLYTLIERDGKFCFVLDTATAANRLGFDRKMEASGLLEPYESQSPEEDQAEMQALREGRTYVSKEPFSDEYGTFLTAVAPIKNRDGRVVGIVGVDLDVADYVHRLGHVWRATLFASVFVLGTSVLVGVLVFRIRKRLERQEAAGFLVREEKEAVEEQNRRLVSALGQIVYHYDVTAKRIDWRGECGTILGLGIAEMPAGPEEWKERLHPLDKELLQACTGPEGGKDSLLVREYRCRHKDGHFVWVLDRAVVTRDASGKPLFADGVLLDISEQKQAESDLMAARDSAEAADRAKSDFLAVMSHEIRTPMNGVIGCASLLLETSITPEQHEYLDTIRKCGDSLLHLINDILDFSKMESGKLTLEKRPFSVRNCVEEALDLYGLMAAEKRLEILAHFEAPDLDWINGDEVRFRQILVNLVGNALKFTSSGEIVVTVGREAWLPGGEALLLSVRDTGIGIARSKQEGIFQPFSQADSSTTRKFGGTGLGLAICGRLATLMGGAITVHSAEGKGAEFVVLIPVEEVKEKNIFPGTGEFRGKSVLVWDDNASFRAMIREMLIPLGFDVTLAGDIETVRSQLETSGPPDVFFVDEGLPDEMLRKLAGMLSSRDEAGRMKTVWLSTPALPHRVGVLPAINARGTLPKPVRREPLLNLLRVLISGKEDAASRSQRTVVDNSPAEKFPLKILVVEDNAINRKVVLQMLKRLGYSAQFAENGRACLDRLAAETFDLVLMDIQMPEMDGYEATSILRRRGDTTWITALTADAMPEDPLRCRIAGMNDYLSKPIRMEKLQAALERCAVARNNPGLPDGGASPSAH